MTEVGSLFATVDTPSLTTGRFTDFPTAEHAPPQG